MIVTATPGAGPFTFPTDVSLALGPHTLKVEATDGRNVQSQTITVTVDEDAPDPGMGSGSGSGSGGGGDDDGAGDPGSHGGCSSSAGGGLALGLLALLVRRRRVEA